MIVADMETREYEFVANSLFVDDPVEVEADEQIVAEKMTGGTCTVHLHLHFCTCNKHTSISLFRPQTGKLGHFYKVKVVHSGKEKECQFWQKCNQPQVFPPFHPRLKLENWDTFYGTFHFALSHKLTSLTYLLRGMGDSCMGPQCGGSVCVHNPFPATWLPGLRKREGCPDGH